MADYTSNTGTIYELNAPDAVRVKAITVRTGRLVCDICIPNERHRYTTPRLAAFAEGHYPDLPHHACVNEIGHAFGDVIENTSTAHLLEHLVISLQVRDKSGGADAFVGTTEWTDEQAGDARIEVSFKDDLAALRAFNEAVKFLSVACNICFE